ncbi:ribonuclease H-like domain-containing protein [Tanacetum coccineum]
MTGSDPIPTPLSEKLSLITHHRGGPRALSHQLCDSYEALKFIHCPNNTSTSSTQNAPTPFTPDEIKVDKIILSWIFTTLSDSLQKWLVIARPNSAKDSWDFIGDLVKDNKRTRTLTLKTELRSIKLGDLSMEAYFQKIESLMTILASLDLPVSADDVVHYVIDGLLEKYNQSKSLASPIDSSSSSPMVLLAESSTSRRPSNPQVKSGRPCFNFARGSCRFGSECRYVNDETTKQNASNSRQSGNCMDALLVKLLDKLGVHDNGKNRDSKTTPTPTNPVAYAATYVAHHALTQPAQYVAPPPGFTYPPAHHQLVHQPALPTPHASLTVGPTLHYQPAQSLNIQHQPAQGLLAAGSVQQAQPSAPQGPTDNTGQATMLPQAFAAGTLHDPTTGTWNMDTGESNSAVVNRPDWGRMKLGESNSAFNPRRIMLFWPVFPTKNGSTVQVEPGFLAII